MCNSSWTFILSELMISARKREVRSTNRLAFSAACGSQDVTSLSRPCVGVQDVMRSSEGIDFVTNQTCKDYVS
ncbi:unnamed protein product [Brassica oleracea]